MGEIGTLFFAIGVDVDPEVEAEFNEWYNTDHLPKVVACPGFVTGRRYEVQSGEGPRFWAVYEVESRDVMKTPELAAISGFAQYEKSITRMERRWLTSLTPLHVHGGREAES